MADRLPIEHYIEECFIKCAQVVLGARIFQSDQAKPAPDKRSARWVRKIAQTRLLAAKHACMRSLRPPHVGNSAVLMGWLWSTPLLLLLLALLPAEPRPKSSKTVVARLQYLLEVEELAGLTAQLEPWRRDVFTPLVIEVGGQQHQHYVSQHILVLL
jgi:hypothetical protein